MPTTTRCCSGSCVTVAEWYTVRRPIRGGVSTFSAIGYPFTFVRVSPHGDPDEVLRCWPEVNLAEAAPDEEAFDSYDLVFRRRQPDEEIDEDGWYLTGIGQHLMWCSDTLEEAVDVAQEHIVWDSRGMSPEQPVGSRIPERPHALRVPDSEWQDDSIWFGMFTGRTPGAK